MLGAGALVATLLVLVPVTGAPVLAHLLVIWEVWPGKSTSIQVSRKHLGTNELILRGKNNLRNILKNILKNGKPEDFEVKLCWHSIFNGVRKKYESKTNEQLQMYFQNSNKFIETRSLLSYITLQRNIKVKVEEMCLQKCQETLESIIVLKLVKQKILSWKKHIEIRFLPAKHYKDNMARTLAFLIQREISKVNINAYNKYLHSMFPDRKKEVIAERKGQNLGLKKYDLWPHHVQRQTSFLIRKKIKVQMQKTITNTSANENQLSSFVHALTYQGSKGSIQKILSTHKTVLSDIQEENRSAFQRKIYRNNKIRTWTNVIRAKEESKSGQNGMEILTIYCRLPSITNATFPAIKIAIGRKCESFSLAMDEVKPSFHMTKKSKHFMQPKQRLKKCFSTVQKSLRLLTVKAFVIIMCLDNENKSYLYEHTFNVPSTLERTRRSTEEKTVQISVDYLKRLTSALTAGATIFGLALFILALAACYLYTKRRQLGQFFEIVLTSGKSRKRSEPIASQPYRPISLSQNFHFSRRQESKKKPTSLSIAAGAGSKKASDFVSIKEIYCSSDTEVSSKRSPRRFTVKSRPYVFSSQSSASIESFCEDACDISSSELSSAEIIMENGHSNVISLTPKEKEGVPVNQPDQYSCNNPECCTSSDVLLELKEARISKSKSENEIRPSRHSSKVIRAAQSLTHISAVQNP